MATPAIRHVRYADFIALVSEGAGTLEGFRRSIDELVRDMGTLHAHHVLFDLRHATIPPLPEATLVQALSELQRLGLGVLNRLAIVIDRDDAARTLRLVALEQIAATMAMRLRGFADYGSALEWLSGPAGD
jgi:hypothetical protein